MIIPYRQPSPRGEGLGGATLRVDFYKRRCPKVVGIAIRRKRISNIWGSQPRLATLDSPFQRKGRECGAFRVYRSLLPLEGGARRAEVGAQSGVKDDADGKTFLHKSLLMRVPYPPPLRSPFPSRGRCPAGADRALAVLKRVGRSVSSRRFMKAPEWRSINSADTRKQHASH